MKHPYRRRLMYLGFQGLRALVQWLPFSVARGLGRTIGIVAYGLLRSYRRLASAQLQEALGQSLTSSQRRRIARGVFFNLGQNAIEWLRLHRLSSRDLQRLIVSEGLDHLRRALSKGNGAIVVSAHFGNWELIPIYLRSLGFEGGVLARRLRYPEYESFLIGMRGDKGIPTFARGSMKDIARLLRANQIVGVMPDQDVDSLEGVFVNFFGRPAYTPAGPAALSLMTGAPILPCFIIREGARFRLVIEPPVRTPETRDRAQAVALLTQAWSEVIESYIRRYPDHWVWMHRRWKTQRPPTRSPVGGTSTTEAISMGQTDTGAVQPVLSLLFALSACTLLLTGGCAKSASPTDVGGGNPPHQVTGSVPSRAVGGGMDETHDQSMDTFTLSGYDMDGTKRWDLEGKGASIDGNTITVHHPDGVGYDAEQTSYLSASVAMINQTNRHVRMEHDVTIHTSDGLWLTSPVLHWIPDDNRMATDTPVRIETDHMVVWGRGLEGLTQLKHMQLLQDIEMVLNPTDEDSPEGPSHVSITCDGPLSFDYEHNIATFEQNVHVKDASGDLYSDTLIAYLEPGTHTIRYAEAIGHVRIEQQQNTAHSDRAIYEPAFGKITLVGRPSLIVYPAQDGSASGIPGTTATLPAPRQQAGQAGLSSSSVEHTSP